MATSARELRAPVIDMEGFVSDPVLAVDASNSVKEACQKHGFFLVVNHKVPAELMDLAYTHMDFFFELDMNKKELGQRKREINMGFFTPSNTRQHSFKIRGSSNRAHPLKQMLSFPHHENNSSTVEDYFLREYSDDFAKFGKVFQEYCDQMNDLSLRIMELLGMSLGIGRVHFREFFQGNESMMVLSYYPRYSGRYMAMGRGPHCDPPALTLHHGSNIDGLQVLVDSEWRSLRPNSKAFVVSIGDIFEALSNGRYKSTRQRSLVECERTVKYMEFYLCPQPDKVVKQPSQLVDEDEHPRMYPDFTWSEMLYFYLNHHDLDTNSLDGFSEWVIKKKNNTKVEVEAEVQVVVESGESSSKTPKEEDRY